MYILYVAKEPFTVKYLIDRLWSPEQENYHTSRFLDKNESLPEENRNEKPEILSHLLEKDRQKKEYLRNLRFELDDKVVEIVERFHKNDLPEIKETIQNSLMGLGGAILDIYSGFPIGKEDDHGFFHLRPYVNKLFVIDFDFINDVLQFLHLSGEKSPLSVTDVLENMIGKTALLQNPIDLKDRYLNKHLTTLGIEFPKTPEDVFLAKKKALEVFYNTPHKSCFTARQIEEATEYLICALFEKTTHSSS